MRNQTRVLVTGAGGFIGAVPQGTWVWDTVQKASALQSNTEPTAAGIHQSYFNAATQTLSINAGDKLVCYASLSTCSPSEEIMLQWSDTITGFNHRAFWGADLIPWGATGTADRSNACASSHRAMGEA